MGRSDHLREGFTRFELFGLSIFEFNQKFSCKNEGKAGDGVGVPTRFGPRGESDDSPRNFGGAAGVLNAGTIPSGGGAEVLFNLNFGGVRFREGQDGQGEDNGKDEMEWVHGLRIENWFWGSPCNCPTPSDRMFG